jgi:hypothetical protein
MSRLVAVAVLALASALPVSTASASTRSYNDHFSGVEVPPVTSTLGTFTGVATGNMPGAWYAQVQHDQLTTGTVSITGGSFTFYPLLGRKIAASIVGGSVTSVGHSADGCSTQTFAIEVDLADGHGDFNGTLTHYGFKFLGTCVVYSASIIGDGTISR